MWLGVKAPIEASSRLWLSSPASPLPPEPLWGDRLQTRHAQNSCDSAWLHSHEARPIKKAETPGAAEDEGQWSWPTVEGLPYLRFQRDTDYVALSHDETLRLNQHFRTFTFKYQPRECLMHEIVLSNTRRMSHMATNGSVTAVSPMCFETRPVLVMSFQICVKENV